MLSLYTETSWQVNPVTVSSVVDLYTPKAQPSASRNHSRDEAGFSKQFLATQSSIYFRHTKTYPRTFLWKVISDDRCLEVRCADTARPEQEQDEAYFTLRFHFADAILPGGVVFTDLDNSDTIHAFVATRQRVLYNICIPTEYFTSDLARNRDPSEWCREVNPSLLRLNDIHVIYALSPLEIYISCTSSVVYKVAKRSIYDPWEQTSFSEKTWTASIRGIISRRAYQEINYNGKHIESTAAHGLLATQDGKHLFTICLDHRLRVWDLQSGRLVVIKDLLDRPREPTDRVQLNPAEPALLRLVRLPLSRHPVLLTYSSYDGGQFKFWDLKGGLTDDLVVEDKYPNMKLSPPDPDPSGGTVWPMTGFDVIPGSDSKGSQLWVLFRNNNYHALYSLHFDFADLQERWYINWVSCTPASLSKVRPPDISKSQVDDVTTKWLEYLFFPGRFTMQSLETALAMLADAESAKVPAFSRTTSLQERMCAVVASRVALRKYDSSQMDYERFVGDTDYHWRGLSRIVQSINERRDAPLSLAVDHFQDMVWIAMADKCCAIRECNTFELLEQNEAAQVAQLETVTASRWPHKQVSSDDGEPLERIATLIKATTEFGQTFSLDLTERLETAIAEELLTSPERSTPHRMLEIYENVNFEEAVSNEVYAQMEKNLEPLGGISTLNDDLFLALLDSLSNSLKRPRSSLQSTYFGLELLSAAIISDLCIQRQILTDLSALVVFLYGELGEEADAMTALDLPDIFRRITEVLSEVERNLWLATNFRKVPVHTSHDAEPAPETMRAVSILEDTLSKDVRPQPVVDRPQTYHLTEMVAEIKDWISGRGWIEPDDATVYVQCSLLKQGDIDLATQFSRFQPDTAWSTYVKGRLCLAKQLFEQAAIYFRKSSYALACGKSIGQLNDMSCGLLSFLDSDSFYNGLPRYFDHVMSLFEAQQVSVQASLFGTLALQARTDEKEPVPNFPQDILARLFEAEMKGCRFEQAFEALLQFTDHALQRTSALELVDAILDIKSSLGDRKASIQLLQTLPWLSQPHLSRHVDQHLHDLARKQTHLPDRYSSDQTDHLMALQTFCTARDDYRGAANALYDRLRLIRRFGKARNDPQATALRQALLALINLITCVGQEEAYILADADDGQANPTEVGRNRKRKIIITLADLRREYQDILDRCARLERGDFDFGMNAGDDEDEDEDEKMEGQ